MQLKALQGKFMALNACIWKEEEEPKKDCGRKSLPVPLAGTIS